MTRSTQSGRGSAACSISEAHCCTSISVRPWGFTVTNQRMEDTYPLPVGWISWVRSASVAWLSTTRQTTWLLPNWPSTGGKAWQLPVTVSGTSPSRMLSRCSGRPWANTWPGCSVTASPVRRV